MALERATRGEWQAQVGLGTEQARMTLVPDPLGNGRRCRIQVGWHDKRRVVAHHRQLFIGDVDARARQRMVGGRRQGLELRDLVALGKRPVHELGCVRRACDSLGELGVPERTLAELDPLREAAQMWRGVDAGREALALEDRGSETRRRRLAVRADDVDRRKSPLRHPERRHQLVHAVEPEPHAEQLEAEQVVLGLAQVQVSASCWRR